jgi:hypothetical protein
VVASGLRDDLVNEAMADVQAGRIAARIVFEL